MCEIYTLMNNGFPAGAFALSRQIYETIVLMDYLSNNKSDDAMIERYFDDIEITKIKTHMKIEEYAQNEISISSVEALKKYAEKHSNFCNKNNSLSDYWWFKKGGQFADIAQETNFPKDYKYKQTSSMVHMSPFNSMTYIGNDQNGILIGETYDGVEEAGWYSMLCFCMAMDIFRQTCAVDLNDLISRGKELVAIVR